MKCNEDFEFYKTPSGINADKVITAGSKSGLLFRDGTPDGGSDASNVIKRIPFSQMSDDDKALARAAYKTLKMNGDIGEVDKKFKTSPRPDVVMKSDGAHADIYYDDNQTGLPDERGVRLAASKRIASYKASHMKEFTPNPMAVLPVMLAVNGDVKSAAAAATVALGVSLGQLIGLLIGTRIAKNDRYKPELLFDNIKALDDEVVLQLKKRSNGARIGFSAAEKFIRRFDLPYEIDDANNAVSDKYWWIYIRCDSSKTASRLAKALRKLKITAYTDLKDIDLTKQFIIDKDDNMVKMRSNYRESVFEDELSDYQKGIIYDMAKADFESGMPQSTKEALVWFESGEDEDIPSELAQEAADYYHDCLRHICLKESVANRRKQRVREADSLAEKLQKTEVLIEKIPEDSEIVQELETYFSFYRSRESDILLPNTYHLSQMIMARFKDGSYPEYQDTYRALWSLWCYGDLDKEISRKPRPNKGDYYNNLWEGRCTLEELRDCILDAFDEGKGEELIISQDDGQTEWDATDPESDADEIIKFIKRGSKMEIYTAWHDECLFSAQPLDYVE